MRAATAIATPPADPERIDHRVALHGVSWQAYEALLAWRGESARPRMTYLQGELEFMAPSWHHEDNKTRLARLIEAWADEMDVEITGAGSWTIRQEQAERGAEPDECYVLGSPTKEPNAPDIAIEVVWTRGGIDKLEVYRKLGVREVWIWQDGALCFHLLRGEQYVPAPRSELLPALDPALIAKHMTASTQTEAVRALRRDLRAAKTSHR